MVLNRNSSILGTNILSEADQVVGLGMRPMIEVISRGMVILFLFALLFSIEMMLAFTIIVILGGAYLLIFKSTKKILRRVGQERFDANQQRFTAVNEAFGASKEVKIFGLEQIFI